MSNVTINKGGFPAPALATVATDQKTIRGSGTSDDPLHAGDGAGATFKATIDDLHNFAAKGMFYGVSTNDTVARASPNAGLQGSGLLTTTIAHPNGKIGTFQMEGPFVATEAEWQAATTDGNPLVAGAIYYSVSSSPGLLFHGVLTPADVVQEVGIALNSTTLLLNISPSFTVP